MCWKKSVTAFQTWLYTRKLTLLINTTLNTLSCWLGYTTPMFSSFPGFGIVQCRLLVLLGWNCGVGWAWCTLYPDPNPVSWNTGDHVNGAPREWRSNAELPMLHHWLIALAPLCVDHVKDGDIMSNSMSDNYSNTHRASSVDVSRIADCAFSYRQSPNRHIECSLVKFSTTGRRQNIDDNYVAFLHRKVLIARCSSACTRQNVTWLAERTANPTRTVVVGRFRAIAIKC